MSLDPAGALRSARLRAGLSQAALAARSGTSQATISAYERGRKVPSVETLGRLLAETGNTLSVQAARAATEPSRKTQVRISRVVMEVLALAEALPVRHHRQLRYPRLPARPL